MSEAEVRACMARGSASGAELFSLNGVELPQAEWAVLQLRQLHRLALEKMLGVLETWLTYQRDPDGDNSVEAVANAIGQGCETALDDNLRTTVARTVAGLKKAQAGESCLYSAASRYPSRKGADVFTRISELRHCPFHFGAEDSNAALALVYQALLFCAVEANNLLKNPWHKKVLLDFDNDRYSLMDLTRTLPRYMEQSPSAFMAHIAKEWVIIRHFHIASTRTLVQRDGRNRFWFIIGDRGLERYAPAKGIGRVPFAQDKLEHILYLCWQSGLLDERKEEKRSLYRLTSAGRARLKELVV